MASISSLDWNRGNFPVRKKRSIIPADQTSIAEAGDSERVWPSNERLRLPPVCSPHFSSTSGALKPLVPARFAFECGLRESIDHRQYAAGASSINLPRVFVWITDSFTRPVALLTRVPLHPFDLFSVKFTVRPKFSVGILPCRSSMKTEIVRRAGIQSLYYDINHGVRRSEEGALTHASPKSHNVPSPVVGSNKKLAGLTSR